MSNPRFDYADVTCRKPHPCHWCPDTIPAGEEATSWSCVELDGALRRRWAHHECDCIAHEEIAEAMGDDDDAVRAPDPGCVPRLMGFWDDRDQFAADVLCGWVDERRDRALRLWDRVWTDGTVEAALSGRSKVRA